MEKEPNKYIEKEVKLIIRVPEDFDREDERMLDDAFSSILEKQGWELVNSEEYRNLPPNELITVNRISIIRERYSEHEAWSDDFWVDASLTPSVALFKTAIEDYLRTEDGMRDIKATCEDFNWGDAMVYVPIETWNKHGIYPLDPNRDPHELGLSPTTSLNYQSFLVNQDEILIPDYDAYYEWQREEEGTIIAAASLPAGWHWRQFHDGSGSLLSPSSESFFSYDLRPYFTLGGIEYRETDKSDWNVFWGSFDDFKNHAENHILHEYLQTPPSLGDKVKDAESRRLDGTKRSKETNRDR